MSEREQERAVQIPVRVVAGEGTDPAARPSFDIYTPKQASRLATFHNMLNRVMEAEHVMRTTNTAQEFGIVNEKGKVVEPYMELNRKFTTIWEQAAQSMYEMEFAGNPMLENAAYNIRDQLRQQYDQGPAKSAEELQRIWEIEDELHSLGGGDVTNDR